jgi:hypothetical protein
MPFDRWGYHFDGPYINCQSLQATQGAYVIWCKYAESWFVLDVGESENVQERTCNHNRHDCWTRNCGGTVYYSATYIPAQTQQQRRAIEQHIRSLTNPPCGEF